ncbi:hypothetical protein PghCCS26_06930 [Paenibacillus glycanilyticus]|uniref:Bactofilin n=1 Tax=Paenibacillus glycanilyticus TaxID=126569 RepID=A0ABQ6NET5_9BACL|nr:polymer-forming cytoskeletal protein [Paenibacillus glycanilyticus]GMK43566.1 hypothetical protein PghCCS26_06930 [Paenibacillus glycanilyticus]
MGDKQRKILITGIGRSGGGDVHLAKIEGVGKIEGDVRCYELSINGKGDVQGHVRAVTASINGMSSIRGGLHADKLNIEGKVSFGGSVTGEQMRMNGMVTVKGSCETEIFEANGRMDIDSLNASQIKLTLQGSSHINEIGGESIHVGKQPGKGFAKWLQSVPGPFANKLSAEVIEGDDVYLEYTTADIVRGGIVRIGPGCTIGSVEYKQSLDVHSSSKIIKHVQR